MIRLPAFKFPTLTFPALPLPLGQPTAGLVIRTTEVELLSMRGKAITSRVRVPVETTEDVAVAKAIQQALREAGLKANKFAVSIPPQDVLFRFFTLPMIPRSEWDAAVQFEARKYIPFKTDGLIWDGSVIQTKSSTTLDVIFAAVQRETFARLQAVLNAAGVVPTRIEARSVSLARLVGQPKDASANEFTCLVDIERESAHLAIVKDRLPYLTREITLPSAETPSVSGAASDVVASPSASPSGPGATEGALDPRAQRLLSELSVSMDFFMREHPSSSVQQVFLFGEEHLIGPWCRWLSERLSRPVELGSQFLDERVDGEIPLSFASAVGLLQGAKRSSRNASLDFLKRSLSKAPSAPQSKGMPGVEGLVGWLNTPQATLVMGLVIASMVGLGLMGAQEVSTERRHLDQLAAARPRVGNGLSDMKAEQLNALKGRLGTQAATLKQILDTRGGVAAKLDALARSLPEGVWFTGLTFENRLEVTGKSQPHLMVNGACFLQDTGRELSAIQTFEEQIKRDQTFFKGFSAARLDQINAQVSPGQQYTYRTFQLNCDPDRKL